MPAPLIIKPRRSPEPGRPFVNRTSELDLIQNKLDSALREDPIPQAITCFWGAYGMGKSWLLQEIERRYRHSGVNDLKTRQTICARLDLNWELVPVLWNEEKLNKEQVISELWKQLATQADSETPKQRQISPETWADEFVTIVTQWSSNTTPLILLDTVDDLIRQDEQAFFWLEEHIVERLALTDRVLFVFTSRGELRRWKRFQVRQRVDLQRLTAFDVDTAGKEVGAGSAASQEIFRHAFGHPLATEQIGTMLENQGTNLKNPETQIGPVEQTLVQKALKTVVDEILEPVSDLAKIAQYASVLRWVSAEPFRYLLDELKLVEGEHGEVYYLDMIAKFQSHHILYWNSSLKSYEYDPVLRNILTHFLELDADNGFREAHLAAYNFHRKHLEQYPQYLARYIPELAYHRISLQQYDSLESSLPTIKNWWHEFFSKENLPINPEPWKELLVALERDDEIQTMLSSEEYNDILSETKVHTAVPSHSLRR